MQGEAGLLLTVRLVDNRYHGMDERGEPEWPPAPLRLFQALMAGAAEGKSIPAATERALDWLERLEPPVIAAPRGHVGATCRRYLPNNDVDADMASGVPYDEAVMLRRIARDTRPIIFTSDTPVLYGWRWWGDDSEAERHALTLTDAVLDLHQVGRGWDAAWGTAEILETEEYEERLRRHPGVLHRPRVGHTGGTLLACPHAGVRKALARRFAEMCERIPTAAEENRHAIRQPHRGVARKVRYGGEPRCIAFGLRNEANERLPAGIEAAGAIGEAALTNAARHLDGQHRLVDADAMVAAGISIRPSGPYVRQEGRDAFDRVVVEIGPDSRIDANDIAWAMARGTVGRTRQGRRRLVEEERPEPGRRSGRVWRTVTPMALPAARPARVPAKREGTATARIIEEAQVAGLVTAALRAAGVRKTPVGIRVQQNAWRTAGPAARRCHAPGSIDQTDLWHVGVAFDEAVRMPATLGAGAAFGLGMMERAEPRWGRLLAWRIEDGPDVLREPEEIADALRRALMARVQRWIRRGAALPAYVTGHEADGSPIRGPHRHVCVQVDTVKNRILMIAPTEIQRGNLDGRSIARAHQLVETAMDGFDELSSRTNGRLRITPTVLENRQDHLVRRSRRWRSVTPYRPTRRTREPCAETLRRDLNAELQRRGWPNLQPRRAKILETVATRDQNTAYRLEIEFESEQPGPLVLGRTSHRGGGLFGAVDHRAGGG